ncbi:flagellar basal-body rod protein FlgF [Roseobacter denitrificans]|uniref:Flagellar basal-body rod protein FlgF n=1 Tax=Roseobacter denitrificans (strain ATCC 33942 / OCh 114) TaxID=375451 RepID=Q16DG0_ROSDO|nr:flagellar hook-basal body complex protein [Roseobacter denitrificans]ABG29983.1 flagellar basal-body rod protein FlgF, putative [Roseobacter denitrificans OCh 114]AVL53191.1 flagellar basal-body rod protein FlgF [Roseobacter denitrificans]SFG39373.1 flagellar basal-body rod protein FlgF [Roseobacter denitrificans OCh 114]
MENSGYTTITRQSGLMKEMRVVANNIANAATSGFRQEGVIFSEYVKSVDGASSLSMGQADARQTSFAQGALTQTGGQFDFAIEGDGFFLVETPLGERLTRAGAFSPNADGDLVTPDGYRVLDAGGAPVFIPPGAADIAVSADGTISTNGDPVGQLGLVQPRNPQGLVREDGVMFRADEGYEAAEQGRILQSFVENSNVNPILQLTRMIEVQRAYELGASFVEAEDERVRQAMRTMSQ